MEQTVRRRVDYNFLISDASISGTDWPWNQVQSCRRIRLRTNPFRLVHHRAPDQLIFVCVSSFSLERLWLNWEGQSTWYGAESYGGLCCIRYLIVS